MAKTGREFPPALEREAVALLEGGGRSHSLVAAERGIQPSMLLQWRTVVMKGSSPLPGAVLNLASARSPAG